MKLLSSQKLSGCSYELVVEVDPERLSKEIEKVYKKQKSRITVPGFRKGKAPKSFIEKYYGDDVFIDEAIESIVPEAIVEASHDIGIEVLNDKIDLDVTKKSKVDGLTFKAKVSVMPEVTLDEYKGIKVKKVQTKITEKDVKKEIEDIIKRHSRLVVVEDKDQPAKIGDTAVIDFEGFIDGENFEGGKADGFPLELGKGIFVPGFEDGVVGHKVGETFEINLKFPEDYHAKQLSGKDVTFKVKLKELKNTELPEFNDKFVSDISEFESTKEFKIDLKKKLIEKAKLEDENKVHIEITEKLSSLVTADIPEILIKNKINELINIFESNLKSQNLSLKDYYVFNSTNRGELEKTFRPEAEKQVKADLALKKIVEIENISATDDDIDIEYGKLQKIYKKLGRKKLEQLFPVEQIKVEIILNKALNLVKENAVYE